MLPTFDPPPYPASPRRPVTDLYFGEAVEDPYRWLEDGDAPEVKAWMQAQNELTRGALDRLPTRAAFKARLRELLQAPRQDAPVHRGDLYFFKRQDGSTPQAQLMVQAGLDGQPRLLIDPNTLSADATISMDWWAPSPEGRYVAYGLSPGGNEQSVLHLIEVASGRPLPLEIPGCRYSSVTWLSDESGFYYTRFPENGANGLDKQAAFFHRLGDDPAADAQVFVPGGGPEMIMWLQITRDDRYVLATVNQGSNTKTELHLLDRQGKPGFQPVVAGFNAYYTADMFAGKLYVRTDEDAPRGKVLIADLARPERDHWQPLIPESQDALQALYVAGGKLVAEYLHNAASRVQIYDLLGRPEEAIAFEHPTTVYGASASEDDPELFFGAASFLEPGAVYRYDLRTHQKSVFFKPDLHIDASAYEAKQVWFTSKDGTQVPMFVVHRRGLELDGQNPALLTAYGGFDISMTPMFSAPDFAWVERGGVLAVPNLRGGGEFGAAWHEGGMRERKQNVFDDFFAAARYLIDHGYTSSKKLGIQGGSNGGLLMGAAITQQPELFEAVVCAVPLLDMLRFHNFLIARYWVPEYGSSEDEAGYRWLKAYSPYHHVRPGTRYPATLIVTGESDTRVDPLHARKMAALLQHEQGGDAPIYLYVESKAGHGAGKPLTKRIETSSDTLGFLAWRLGLATEEQP